MYFRVKNISKNIKLFRNYSYQLNHERIADFPNSHETKGVAEHWNNIWDKKKYFYGPDNSSFKMILPPPNVTGALHLGHGYTVTIQDVLARWYRMNGKSVTWIPGLDHGGIATQVVVEKYLLATKGIKKNDISKDEFLNAIEQWKCQKENTINKQLKYLGASLDWSKEYYTMSKEHNNAVNEAFLILYNRGLLYRKNDLVNWSPALQSTISDIEVDTIEVNKKTYLSLPGYKRKIAFGEIYNVSFKIKDSNDEIIVSTTRIESMHGDTAIAVNPNDSRYNYLIGKQVYHPLRDTFIPIIGDDTVKIDYGTGALKITPAHSRIDLEIAQKHNLNIINVINENGLLNENTKSYNGLPRYEARYKIINELNNIGALKDIKDHQMTIPICSRTGDVIEYIMKEQWFLNIKKMSINAKNAVNNNLINIDPPKYKKIWIERLDNIKDWCISRQLSWGHKIPAYLCHKNNENYWIIAKNYDDALNICQNKYGHDFNIKQDCDVLDTWFSAGLLPMTTMGWPNNNYKNNYPLSLMETGHDILLYWVSRMIMLCTELSGKIPFNEILLHGILCDSDGKKMSKSLGNVINPEWIINGITIDNLLYENKQNFNNGIINENELKRANNINLKNYPNGIQECGIDALRLTFCSHDIKNERINFNINDCITNKHFCNKIWQACKFVLLVTDDKKILKPDKLSQTDCWILSKMNLMIYLVNLNIQQRHFHRAVLAIKQFFYYEFCDYYLETTKLGLASDNNDIVNSHKWTMIKCLEVSLRTLSPFMPYLSDDLYSRLANKLPNFSKITSLNETSYPTTEEFDYKRDEKLENKFDDVIKIILSMRNILNHINKKFISSVDIVIDDDDKFNFYNNNKNFIISTSRINNLNIFKTNNYEKKNDGICTRECECQIYYYLTDNNVVDQVKNNISNKRLQVEEKLNKLLDKISTQKYINITSEEEQYKNNEKVKILQLEIQKYPKFL